MSALAWELLFPRCPGHLSSTQRWGSRQVPCPRTQQANLPACSPQSSLNAERQAGKQQIPFLKSLSMTRQGNEPQVYRLRSRRSNYYTIASVIVVTPKTSPKKSLSAKILDLFTIAPQINRTACLVHWCQNFLCRLG